MVHVIVGSEVASEIASRLRQAGLERDVTLLKVDRQGRGDALEGADAALRWDLNDDGLRYVLNLTMLDFRWVPAHVVALCVDCGWSAPAQPDA